MAYYAALVSLVHLLYETVHRDRYPNFHLGRQPIIKSLFEKFSLLEAILEDYSSKGDEANDRVEARIRDVAYRAQDVIESEISNQIEPDGIDHESYAFINQYAVDELEEVDQDLNFVIEDTMAMKERQLGIGSFKSTEYYSATGVLKQMLGRNTMVGFDEQLTTIKDELCGHSSQLQIIPIAGMGGIGKTTLGRHTFNDALIVYHFDIRGWVTVSQDYNATKVLQSILNSMGIAYDPMRVEDEKFLKELIYKSLKGHRYLIVIDDLWSTEVWDDLKHIFPNDSNGSRILLTTRLIDVARYAGNSSFLHEMQFLNVNSSWILLRKKVFVQDHCPPELEDIGMVIASKCRGLPLAIVVIAGILSQVRNPQHWNMVARNVGSFLSESGDEHLSNILSLSYNHLSHSLKACFLYMGSFPEDYEINVRGLTRLWVAEGFLKLSDGSKTLEQVAEECLEDLVKRNLVIITKKRGNGRFKQCVVHDILRDFCQQRAVRECFFHGLQWLNCFRTYEKASSSSTSCMPWEAFGTRKHVRTILWFSKRNLENTHVLESRRFRLLKILDAADAELLSVPRFLDMIHLKYLTLRFDCVKNDSYLPIFRLPNLEALNLYFTSIHEIVVPYEIWKMRRLRHLIIGPAMVLLPIPVFSGSPFQRLEHLQTLEMVRNFEFSNKVIEMIPNIRKLKLFYGGLDTIHSWEHYSLDNLFHLVQLEELKISCLQWEELTAMGSLPSLQVLKLEWNSFVGETWEPIEGEFLQLKFLFLKQLNLKHWRADNTHFPRLQHLYIQECPLLKEIPIEIGDIPTLESITVLISWIAGYSAKLILEEQRRQGNDVLQVHVRNWG
ncbi:putative late blight resistance protein homolog R1B-16 [Andrographis paniculata]|uniref:putative late blight resistance protein homolog R1B-16 n=1 Tax=Andrographis paniculata TaxID=175694 RepID=UPI0021E92AD6|nr:putative late blight resistance protein homolog R1B-16 [Andrographis paniculata]